MTAAKRAKKNNAAVVAADSYRTLLWLFVGLLLITLVAYAPAWHGTRLWDDDAHLTRVDLRSAAGLWQIWFSPGATAQYYPVAHSAFWFMHALWGESTLGYHLVNIVLHASSAWLLVVILLRLNVPGAMLAGLIFAVHPVHVESVAWMTELKNTLSGVLYLLAAFSYLRFDRDRRRAPYLTALVLFVLALLAKSVTATLPAALLVVFWWQRGRLRWREDVIPLLPFFAMGLLSGWFTAFVERVYIGATGADYQIPFLARVAIAGRALWFYLGKLAWPSNLIFMYPKWPADSSAPALVWTVAALAVLAALWTIRRRSRAPLAAMLFFAGTLFPALGFVNVYPFKYTFVADHFQYLASIGMIALAAAGLTWLARKWMNERDAFVALALVVCLPFALLTFRQSRQYADAETLYRTTLARNPNALVAHIKLGELYFQQQRFELAVAETREALRLTPDSPELKNNLGTILFRSADAMVDGGDIAAAIAMYRESLRLNPTNPETHHNLGSAFARSRRWTEAIAEFEETLRLNPASDRAARHLAQAKAQAGVR